jgi:hypothetical protein
MKSLPVALLFVASVLCSSCAEDSSQLIGIYSNKAEGFNVKSVILDINGKGMFAGGVGGVPVLWKKDGDTITVTGPLGENQKDASVTLKYDESKKEILILDEKYSEGSKPLQFVQKEIPEKFHQMLMKFDGTMKSLER